MFHYWFPKGAGFLGLGCLLVGGIMNHHHSKEVDRKIAQMRKEGRGVMHTPHGDVPLG